jgi:acyl carrier protein
MTPVAVEAMRGLLKEAGLLPSGAPVGDSDSLFDQGILDSIRLFDLVSTIESRFGIRVRDTDLIPDNFDTLAGLSAYLSNRVTGALD